MLRTLNSIMARLCGFPTDLYVMRHGESFRNVGLANTTTRFFFDTQEQFEEFGKHPDHQIPLTENGKIQAKEAGQRFAQAVYDGMPMPNVAVHSGWTRARHTAHYVFEQFFRLSPRHGIRENFCLREREVGISHILLAHEVKDAMGWNERYWKCFGSLHGRPLGGESMLELREGRIRSVLRDEYKKSRGKALMFVCHGRVMQAIHMEILDMDLQQMEDCLQAPHPQNCEIRHYRFDRRTRKMVYVDVI
jgi:broad specificity phosphatase PhoE